MGKNKLLLLPFFVGLVLMIYSWYLSYPLSTSSVNDVAFNHISILYWFSLPLLLASMFLMAMTTKNNYLKWILSIGIVLTFFSLSYFYFFMPTADSQLFRGYTEYFISTKSLDPSQANHGYYQWPSFFILADVVTSISGLTLQTYEFLLYTIIGFLLVTALYVYGSKRYANSGVLLVAAFFISLAQLIDYQAVPFSLGLALLFVLFMLETQQRSVGLTLTLLVLYASLSITHLFVPLFFVLYLFGRTLFDKNSQNRRHYSSLLLFALVSYLVIEITMARFSFGQLIKSFLKAPSTYSGMVSSALAPSSVPNITSVVAQFFSKTLTIAAILTCVVGLILLLVKRKTNALDKAILLCGLVYSSLGVVLNTLGYRAIAVAFIPVSLGAAFLFKSKFRSYLTGFFLVLLVLCLFVPLHQSFNTGNSAQTKENYVADNFFLNHYNWKNPGFVVTDFWTSTYLSPKMSTYEYISTGLGTGEEPNAILYTPQFEGLKLGNYSSMESLSQGERLNVEYNDGSSFVLIKPS